MRSFPSARLSLATLALASMVGTGIAVPLANANDEDDLREKQEQVEDAIEHAEHELEHASARVARATRRLDGARTSLVDARAQLRETRAQLKTSRTRAAELKKDLAVAERKLDAAAVELRAARADVAVQREQVRVTVIDNATGGTPELALIDSFLDSGSVEEVIVNELAGELAITNENDALLELRAAEEAMQDHKDRVEAARDEVEDKKRRADEEVRRIAGLVESAAASRTQIVRLVAQTERARRQALRARAADRAALQRLQVREDRIRRQILELAQQNPGDNYRGDTDGFLQPPVAGPVTSPYGYRTHPIYGYWGLHDGTDFGAACGAPLWAGENGTVINTYYDEVYGNRLYLSVGRVNGANLTLVYNHLSSYAVGEGATVGRGDVVGRVGSTGWSTGCHLHFTVLRNGQPVDPMNYM